QTEARKLTDCAQCTNTWAQPSIWSGHPLFSAASPSSSPRRFTSSTGRVPRSASGPSSRRRWPAIVGRRASWRFAVVRVSRGRRWRITCDGRVSCK
ncbi:hypothetical protein T310_9127, partial [Rasamsonia emersonii CBS 393.64]